MNYPSLRHVSDVELAAKTAIAHWPLHDGSLSQALSYIPPPQGTLLVAVEAYRQELCWRGYVDLNDWFEHVAPELASLAGRSDLLADERKRVHTELVLSLFAANPQPLEMPISELFYDVLHIRHDVMPPPPQCLLSLMTAQGRIWLSDYPHITPHLNTRGVSASLQALPIMLAWRLGSSYPSLRLIKQLRRGDVLLIGREKFDITSAGKVVGYFSINEEGEVAVQTASLNQTDSQENIDEHVEMSAEVDGQSHVAQAIKNIPLRIDFILQHRMTTVSDLDTLYRGQIMQFDPQAERKVEICINGVRIARGELVELNGRLGVELQDISIGQVRDEKHCA